MGIANFIFGNAAQRTQFGTGGLIIDATRSLNTGRNAIITESAVEKGANISDHARLGPLTLDLDCFISPSPTDEMQSFISTAAGAIGAGAGFALGKASKVGGASLIGTGLGAAVGSRVGSKIASGWFPGGTQRDENYPKTAFRQLLSIQESFEPFTIKTFMFKDEKDSIYQNMVIQNLSIPQVAADGIGLSFRVQLRSIRIATLQFANVTGQFIKGNQAANSAEKKTEKGAQGTKVTDPKTAENTTNLSALTGTGEVLQRTPSPLPAP